MSDELMAAFWPIHATPGQVAVRLAAAALMGMVIGFDREKREKPAGLRTHMLVSLAAAAFTLITFEMLERVRDANEVARLDPSRLVEAVVTGVAFLGAGTIIQSRGKVRGVTTGASIWLVGALGIACGAGFFLIALMVLGLAYFVLVAIGYAERHLFKDSPDE